MMISKITRSLLVILGVFLCAGFVFWGYHVWVKPSWESFEKECRELRDHQEWPQLGSVAERWSKLYSDRADPWLYRAEAADGLQDLEAEADYLDHVPTNDSRAVSALIRKGRLEFEPLNHPWIAQKTCDRILEIDSRVLGAHQQSIYFCALTLQRAELIRRIRAAIRIRRESPQSYLYLAGASWYILPETYQMNTHWLEGDPENETFEVARAMHVYRSDAKKKPDRAAEFAHIPEPEILLQKYPQNLELLDYFLDQKVAAGDLEEVEKLVAAMSQDAAKKDARYWRALGWIHETRGEFDEAERLIRKGIAIDPYWRNLHYDLSQILRRTERIKEAELLIKIHEASRNLSVMASELKEPHDTKFLKSMLELAKMVDDFDVVEALRARLSSQ